MVWIGVARRRLTLSWPAPGDARGPHRCKAFRSCQARIGRPIRPSLCGQEYSRSSAPSAKQPTSSSRIISITERRAAFCGGLALVFAPEQRPKNAARPARRLGATDADIVALPPGPDACARLGQEAELSLLDGVPGVQVEDGPRPQLQLARRITTFDKVTSGLDKTTALYEARKCPSCGNCFDVGPDNAVIRLGSASGTRPSLTTAKAAASAPPSAAAKPSRYSPRRSELQFPSVASQTDQGHSTRDHQDQGPGSVAPATDIVKC